jgi:hypothetical protein
LKYRTVGTTLDRTTAKISGGRSLLFRRWSGLPIQPDLAHRCYGNVSRP